MRPTEMPQMEPHRLMKKKRDGEERKKERLEKKNARNKRRKVVGKALNGQRYPFPVGVH